MKKRLVAAMLILAVCSNLHTTVFAAKDSAWSDEQANWETEIGTKTETIVGTTDPSDTTTDTTVNVEDTSSVITGSNTTVIEDETVSDTKNEDTVNTDTTVKVEDTSSVITGSNTTIVEDETTTTDNTVNAGSATVDTTVGIKVEENKGTTTSNSSANITADGKGEFKVVETTVGVSVDGNKKDEEKDEKTLRNEKIQQELKDYAASLGFTDNRLYGKDAMNSTHEYAEQPVIGKDSCVAGKLSDSTLKEGLDLINMIRKTAGLCEVTLDDTYNEYAQNGALIMKASEDIVINGIHYGGLSHTPIRAENISDEQAKLGSTGTRSGNIGYGHTSLTETILNGYMFDGDGSNIAAMGHRRWILNPTMTKVGFGQVEEYNCMYAHDNSGTDKIEDFVTWPAENMPIELMTYETASEFTSGTSNKSMPWTCQLGSNYKIVPSKNLTITVTYPDGHEYKVPQSAIFCNNQNYGYTNGCITFRADDFNIADTSFETLGSNYSVKIDGVLDKNGNATSIEYDVNFFSLF